MLPVIVAVGGRIACLDRERIEQLRRSRDDVRERPRHYHQQVLWLTHARRDEIAERRLLLFRQHVPALQLNAHDDLGTFGWPDASKQYVRERLWLTDPPIQHVLLVRVPDTPHRVQRGDNLDFERRSQRRIQRVEIGSQNAGDDQIALEHRGKRMQGSRDRVVQAVMCPVFRRSLALGFGWKGRRVRRRRRHRSARLLRLRDARPRVRSSPG